MDSDNKYKILDRQYSHRPPIPKKLISGPGFSKISRQV